MAGIHQLWSFDPVTGGGGRPRRHHERGAARRSGGGRVVRPDLRPGDGRRPALAGRRRDLVAAAPRGRSRVHRRRHRALRLRPRRRAGRDRAAAAPARRDGAARRLRRGRRHLQRRRTAVRPRVRAGDAPCSPGSPSRARRCSSTATWWSSSPRPTGSPGSGCPRRRWSSTAWRSVRTDPSPRCAPGEVGLEVVFSAAGRPEARRALRPGDPAGRDGDTARAAARGRGSRRGSDPAAGARRARRRRCPARRRDGGVLRRRGRRGVPGLPRAPAGLGRPGPARRGRPAELRLYLAG